MPELPDIELYLSCLRSRIEGQPLLALQTITPFVLRSIKPEPKDIAGLTVTGLQRLGKRVVLDLEGYLFVVIHLMVSGRFRWLDSTAKPPARISHAVFWFENGNLVLTEASSKKRASIYIVEGEENLKVHDPGGIDVLTAPIEDFQAQLQAENRTLKRALTNPTRFSGIGNAYSDEILWRAKISPVRLTSTLTEQEVVRLQEATKETLIYWTEKLTEEYKTKFPGPGNVTAFRPDFAVHGKFGQPCPECGKKVQRIQYAENETNYCAQCQNEGRLLADRSLSRLLKDDWPKTLEQLEQ